MSVPSNFSHHKNDNNKEKMSSPSSEKDGEEEEKEDDDSADDDDDDFVGEDVRKIFNRDGFLFLPAASRRTKQLTGAKRKSSTRTRLSRRCSESFARRPSRPSLLPPLNHLR